MGVIKINFGYAFLLLRLKMVKIQEENSGFLRVESQIWARI